MERSQLSYFAPPTANIICLNANRTINSIDSLDVFIDLINCMTNKPDVVFISESDSCEGTFDSVFGSIDSNNYRGFRIIRNTVVRGRNQLFLVRCCVLMMNFVHADRVSLLTANFDNSTSSANSVNLIFGHFSCEFDDFLDDVASVTHLWKLRSRLYPTYFQAILISILLLYPRLLLTRAFLPTWLFLRKACAGASSRFCLIGASSVILCWTSRAVCAALLHDPAFSQIGKYSLGIVMTNGVS